MMTTNHLEHLDRALIRPGRVDKKIELPNADKDVMFRLFLLDGLTASLKECMASDFRARFWEPPGYSSSPHDMASAVLRAAREG